MTQRLRGFSVVELLAALTVLAILVTMTLNVRFGSLELFVSGTRLTAQQSQIKQLVWRMTIAPDRPVLTLKLEECNNAEIQIGAGGLVEPLDLDCNWGKSQIDKAGNLRGLGE